MNIEYFINQFLGYYQGRELTIDYTGVQRDHSTSAVAETEVFLSKEWDEFVARGYTLPS